MEQIIPVAAVLLPLMGSLAVVFNLGKISVRESQYVTCTLMALSALAGGYTFIGACFWGKTLNVVLAQFIQVGALNISWTLFFDSLSGLMVGIITFISFFVHIYSVGYMQGEENLPRFMAYLSLFTFCMLLLVTSPNLLQLFVGWEGVGLCSYLLIGFYHKRKSANAAAQKAFIVNRIGDVGFILGMCLVFALCGTLSFSTLEVLISSSAAYVFNVPFLGDVGVLEISAALFFWSAVGKSAQLGLHVWLPDAMEAPTPVSALMHAATMVTAGVFLMVRLSPLLAFAPYVREFIFTLGALTAFITATIACVQVDIKRVIAYSTCSQLGYMFMAVGVEAYNAALFHLTTHAFFKALIFLSAGSVIRSCSGIQDMREMGGIWRLTPWTYVAMGIGSLALSGIPIFAGYYSKDAILRLSGYVGGQLSWGYILGVLATFLTAFYSMRLMIMVFHGPMREDPIVAAHVHESSWVMRIPLCVLSLGSLSLGYLGTQIFLGPNSFLSPFSGSISALTLLKEGPFLGQTLPLLLSVFGLCVAFLFYGCWPALPLIGQRFGCLFYMLFLHKWYFDDFYSLFIVRPFRWICSFLSTHIDKGLIDRGITLRIASFAWRLGAGVVKMQTGYVSWYIFVMLMALLTAFGCPLLFCG
jgi:NADH-quinone oxidoreductase subunit L